MTSKLFMNVRERLSLCYSIGSGYHGSKGILTVSAGIDTEQYDTVRQEIAAQLEACCRGQITQEEMTSAKEAIFSSLRSVTDSPGAIENFYITSTLSGMPFEIPGYMEAISAVTVEDVAEVAKTVQLHTSFVLKGVGQ
jgi:predicted Zn-dependent peptidase